jgi:hypothetical protein
LPDPLQIRHCCSRLSHAEQRQARHLHRFKVVGVCRNRARKTVARLRELAAAVIGKAQIVVDAFLLGMGRGNLLKNRDRFRVLAFWRSVRACACLESESVVPCATWACP